MLSRDNTALKMAMLSKELYHDISLNPKKKVEKEMKWNVEVELCLYVKTREKNDNFHQIQKD